MTAAVVIADAGGWVNGALGAFTRTLGRLSLLDWILVAVALILLVWVWTQAVAEARLGTIEIADLATDHKTVHPASITAALQQSLGNRGLLPASGVPGGSPTVASLASAVAGVPIGQVSAIAGLVALIPTPPTSTSFKIAGTLRTKVSDDGRKAVGLSYQLVCLGPRPSVKLAEAWAPTWPELVEVASKELFRKITEQAPGIYPAWVRWSNSEALTRYREATDVERGVRPARPHGGPRTVAQRHHDAYDLYRAACELDPDNMLARLRAANCLERIAAGTDSRLRSAAQLEALQAYVAIVLRQPTIFQAGFRASVLLSSLAHSVPDLRARAGGSFEAAVGADAGAGAEAGADAGAGGEAGAEAGAGGEAGADAGAGGEVGADAEADALAALERALRTVLRRLGEASAAERPTVRRLSRLGAAIPRRRPAAPVPAEQLLGLELDAAARQLARLARRRLGPLWTVINEGRFRHRFEPVGQERRQLRKALGISQMCLRARRAALGRGSASELEQYIWRAWVFWRYFAGRSRVAGWQAHYNAACFYALLPQADPPDPSRGRRATGRRALARGVAVRRRALRHLAVATSYGDRDLSCGYARDEDPDLRVLRLRSRDRFELVLRPICPDEVVVHYRRPPADGVWELHVTGEAAAARRDRPPGEPLLPAATTESEAVYRIRIFDEHKPLAFAARLGERDDAPGWELIPAEHGSNVWVDPGRPEIHDAAPATVPAAADRPVG